MSGRWATQRAFAAMTVGAAILWVVVPAAAGPGNAQSPGHSPLPVFSALYGASCPSASSCVAVGGYNDDGMVVPLAESWGGAAWSVRPSPSPAGATSSQLNAVSCTSTTNCLTVGTYSNSAGDSRPFAERWDGSSWALVDVPIPVGGSYAGLSGVSCADTSFCVAVGGFTNRRSVPVPLVEAWDGAAWTVRHSPHPAGAGSSSMTSVSCVSTSLCLAAGSYLDADSVGQPLAERWDGASWTVLAAPSPVGAQGSYLNGISCPTASRCVAVGGYYDADFTGRALAESWDGSSWSVAASPSPDGSPNSALYSVSCAADSQCLAVGHSYSSSFAGKDGTLAETWNGTSWTIVASPSPSTGSGLSGVSCAGTTQCAAVGSFFNSSNDYQTLTEFWNGSTLSIGNRDSVLSGVACRGAAHCVAVGSAISPDSVSVTVAQVWNGKQWRTQHTPNPADSEGAYLEGVDCASRNVCVAVGYYYNLDNTRLTLIETWDGTHWTITPSPSLDGAAYSVLYGVTCTSTTWCTAVGSGDARVLAEIWNGAVWTIVPSGNADSSAYGELTSATCTSPSHCLAVGYETDTHYHADLTLAERWNGSAWKVVPSAMPGRDLARSSVLHGVSCSSADSCLAVGYRQRKSGAFVAFTEQWTGTGWIAQDTPGPTGSSYSSLSAISCIRTGQCRAVGSYLDEAGRYASLVDKWSGKQWRVIARPSPAAVPLAINYLEDVSCTRFTCMAVGAKGNPANLDPLRRP